MATLFNNCTRRDTPMIERFLAFAPSMGTILALALGTTIYLRLSCKSLEELFKDEESRKRNRSKIFWRITFPLINVNGPLWEELVFRAPLVLLFPVVSNSAWLGIGLSSIAFGSTHWSQNYGTKFETKKEEFWAGLAHTAITGILGAFCGYYAIKHQSVWIAVGLHALWNLILPNVLPFIILLISLVWMLMQRIWENRW